MENIVILLRCLEDLVQSQIAAIFTMIWVSNFVKNTGVRIHQPLSKSGE